MSRSLCRAAVADTGTGGMTGGNLGGRCAFQAYRPTATATAVAIHGHQRMLRASVRGCAAFFAVKDEANRDLAADSFSMPMFSASRLRSDRIIRIDQTIARTPVVGTEVAPCAGRLSRGASVAAIAPTERAAQNASRRSSDAERRSGPAPAAAARARLLASGAGSARPLLDDRAFTSILSPPVPLFSPPAGALPCLRACSPHQFMPY